MAIPKVLQGRLALPVIVSPMFLVSGPDLVVACCTNGTLGTFPSLNQRTARGFEEWLSQIKAALAAHDKENPDTPAAPYGVNLIAHKSNTRLDEDLALVVKYEVPLVITSVGNPREIVKAVHAYGGLVFHDVTTVEWARKAADAGVDGIIPVCAGAGGHAGLMNPFAIVPQIREFWDGPIALSGCISDGRSVRAAEVLGADFAYMGTRFVATVESMGSEEYKAMLLTSQASDLLYTPAFSGIPATMLRPSIVAAGMDPDRLPDKNRIDLGEEFNHETKAWRDIWTAGQGVGSIHDVPSTAALIARLKQEYASACAETQRLSALLRPAK